ncbi:MAG: DUF1538 domain-containing protein [bacterium]|jgi:hypothetical protein
MSPIFAKTKEVTRALIPVMILVLILCFTIVEVAADVIIRFIIGSGLLLIGLAFFLWGIDLAMNPIGEYMSREVATSRTPAKFAALSFLLGFLITVAEPDLLILAAQIETAAGNTLSASVIVYLVSIGVGIMISLGVFRLLRDKPLNSFMAITYAVILALTFLVSEEFLAISFDASGATTGALTTPFVLALSLGLSTVKGGKNAEENSFGLVGIMSAGPILAVLLMSMAAGQKNIRGDAGEYIIAAGVVGPIIKIIPAIFLESLIALLPITILFLVYNTVKFKAERDELSGIIKGLVFTLLGLTLFLTAVNSGFMDMGRIIGMELAEMNRWVLIGTGALLGLIVVLVEPAVHVLGEQIEEVTGGHIPAALIRMTLSIGVALAVSLSMVRIVVPEVKLWYFLLPGFAAAILLSFRVDPVFVGIAYDAGGVASGPMTATFVLAFAQGAATVIETADVLVDGFGVIAMVAMAPVLSIMVLGIAFTEERAARPAFAGKRYAESPRLENDSSQYDCILVIVNRGFAEQVVAIARQAGATGATIMHGRGADESNKVLLPLMQIELQPEKEIIWFITDIQASAPIADGLLSDARLVQDGDAAVFLSPAAATAKAFASEPAGIGDLA